MTARRARGYTRALIPAVGDDRLVHYYRECADATVAERFERTELLKSAPRTLILASGNGGNFQAVLDAARSGKLPLEIVGLISNNRRAYAIERARAGGVPACASWIGIGQARESRAVIRPRVAARRRALTVAQPRLAPRLDASAGGAVRLRFSRNAEPPPRVLAAGSAARRGRAARWDADSGVPRAPRGARDALAAASSNWVGATLHRVTAQTDRGPVMARKPLRVEPGEDEDHLMERVHAIEHRLVVAGITRWLYESRP